MDALNDEINDEILAILEADANNDSVRGFVITGYGKQLSQLVQISVNF